MHLLENEGWNFEEFKRRKNQIGNNIDSISEKGNLQGHMTIFMKE